MRDEREREREEGRRSGAYLWLLKVGGEGRLLQT